MRPTAHRRRPLPPWLTCLLALAADRELAPLWWWGDDVAR